jgi:DNA-binding MarR family transcriptional regulator
VKLLRLTAKGRKVRRAALAASHAIERELRRELGDLDVDALRAALESLLERHAALEDARAGRSRAPW